MLVLLHDRTTLRPFFNSNLRSAVGEPFLCTDDCIAGLHIPVVHNVINECGQVVPHHIILSKGLLAMLGPREPM